MKYDTIAKLTIFSIISSPVWGGIIGRLTGELNICGFPNTLLDSGLCYLGIIAWIIASLLFYHHYSKKCSGPDQK